MKNISFSLTTDQVRNRTKTVTRRLGWIDVREGSLLMGCVKCMGLKGEPMERICPIIVTSVRREALGAMHGEYGDQEAIKEGFPNMSGNEFVDMFCEHMKCDSTIIVTRIEFRYLSGGFDLALSRNQESKDERQKQSMGAVVL